MRPAMHITSLLLATGLSGSTDAATEVHGPVLPAFPPPPSPVTEFQKKMLRDIAPLAEAASKAAEAEILQILDSTAHRLEMELLGDSRLAKMAPVEALAELKGALSSVEYLANIGGFPFPNVTTLDLWGFYPNRWERRLMNDSCMDTYSDERLWKMWDTQEVSLYRLKPFAIPQRPTWEEAIERQSNYGSVNIRRLGAGIDQFGPFAFFFRDSVVRERSVLISADSGGFTALCNTSVGLEPPFWKKIASEALFDCTAMGGPNYTEPGWHAAPARPGMELHNLLNNVKAYHKVPGHSFTRLMWQMVSPDAHIRKYESHMYTEFVTLGSTTMRDLKAIVADFESWFGTKDGDNLADFCRRHKLPLVWGRGFGASKTEKSWWSNLEPTVKAGSARILDVRTFDSTNATSPSENGRSIWAAVDKQARAFRATGREVEHEQALEWWTQLMHFPEAVVLPMRPGVCENPDLCFGVKVQSGQYVCNCRLSPDDVDAPLVIV